MIAYSYTQDGADFYIYGGDPPNDTLIAGVTYPNGVRDFDLVAAQKAEAWFLELMARWNIQVRRK